MKRNVEIKARIENTEDLIGKVKELADEGPVEISQVDIFFNCLNGRLKLRSFPSGEGELIFYRRPNRAGPKESNYVIYSTAQPDILSEVLSQAYGQSGRVHKMRTLFQIGRTRIHLDKVQGLGNFLELEVVLADNETSENGYSEAYDLLNRLGIRDSQLIEKAYIDLQNEKIR
jgi:predicted adenylyl cyclase CyaB